MTDLNDEAAPIARLVGEDRKCTVGWVYCWNTSELSILWIGKSNTAAFIDPGIRPEILEKAKTTTPVGVIAFLAALLKSGP